MCPTPSNNLAPSRGTLTVILLHLSSVFRPSTILRESQDGDICVVEVNKWTSVGVRDYTAALDIKHIHRERNMVADLLAKNSTLNAKGICIFNEPPDLVTNVLLDDIVGVTRCRTVNTSSAG
ncbi:hypothetical protein ACLB2K_068718 [Fragaria x ananassa]